MTCKSTEADDVVLRRMPGIEKKKFGSSISKSPVKTGSASELNICWLDFAADASFCESNLILLPAANRSEKLWLKNLNSGSRTPKGSSRFVSPERPFKASSSKNLDKTGRLMG